MKKLKEFIGYKKSGNFDNCVKLALMTFVEFYDHSIKNLLTIFPADAKDKDGAAFWSGPKRCPSPVEFDPTNKVHVDFVGTYANLIAATLKIDENRDFAAICEIAKKIEIPAFVPKKIKVVLPGEEEKANEEPDEPLGEDDEKLIEQLINELGEE